MGWTQDQLEERINAWRQDAERHNAKDGRTLDEWEGRLREHVAALGAGDLTVDEAILLAVRRIGREKGAPFDGADQAADRREWLMVVGLAIASAVVTKLPELFGHRMVDDAEGFYALNASFFVLPLMFGYFGWKRSVSARTWLLGTLSFVVAALFVNGYPFAPKGSTQVLSALHVPVALWLVVGVAYASGHFGSRARRMDFVRFSGQLFIFYVLIALGGGVLMMITAFLFRAIELDAAPFIEQWMLPCGAAGAALVAAGLAESKQRMMEAVAPVLTRLFTPLFAAVMLVFLITMAWTQGWIDIDRDVLIGFDLLLVIVTCLILYAISSRDQGPGPNLFDVMQLILVVAALLVDVLALIAIGGRISEFGVSPNKVVALGLNLILLSNLAGTAWLYAGFLRGATPLENLERWQTAYLPIYAGWAAVVFIAFPPFFGFA